MTTTTRRTQAWERDHYVREFTNEFDDELNAVSAREARVEIARSLTRHLVYEHRASSIYLLRERPLNELVAVHARAHDARTHKG